MEELKLRKIAQTAALFSNPNYDSDDADRAGAVETLEQEFEAAVEFIYSEGEDEEEIDENNPFFAAASKGVAEIEAPREDADLVRDQFEGLNVDQ